VLGLIVEVDLAIIFLFGTSFLLFRTTKHRIIGAIFTIIVLLLCEANYYYQIIEPVVKAHDEQFEIRWIARPGIILLDSLVIWFYKKNNDLLVRNLEKRTLALEAAIASKNFFIRVTNHELKGPLNAIHEISQTLLLNTEEKGAHYSLNPLAEDLYIASNTALQEISNVLDMSKIEAGRINEIENESFDIRQFLTNLVKVNQYTANQKEVEILTDFHEKLPAVIISDKAKLMKITNNLLVNAIKFTANKSRVIIKAFIKDEQLYIAVKDHGKGIEKNRLKTIFTPFETEKNALIEGTGLGLFIARHFVELLNGGIAVDSNGKNGTTFTVNIPFEVGQATDKPSAAPKLELPSYEGKKVMICEDNQISLLYLTKYLEKIGCTVFSADNGIDGIDIAQREQLDLVILDSHMPGMDGKAALEYIRNDLKQENLPVIVISGDTSLVECEELLQSGANDYLLKPIDFRTLSDTMRKYLASPSIITNNNPTTPQAN
jgi:signal transduction histidine kinase/CheY-like chemotaxis protein